MQVTYSDKARQSGESLHLLQQATKRLEEVLGSSADLVTAEWDRTEDARRRIQYTLTLRDSTGEVRASFSASELSFDDYVRSRLNRLWGDLLQIRSDEQHRKVLQLLSEMEGS